MSIDTLLDGKQPPFFEERNVRSSRKIENFVLSGFLRSLKLLNWERFPRKNFFERCSSITIAKLLIEPFLWETQPIVLKTLKSFFKANRADMQFLRISAYQNCVPRTQKKQFFPYVFMGTDRDYWYPDDWAKATGFTETQVCFSHLHLFQK